MLSPNSETFLAISPDFKAGFKTPDAKNNTRKYLRKGLKGFLLRSIHINFSLQKFKMLASSKRVKYNVPSPPKSCARRWSNFRLQKNL